MLAKVDEGDRKIMSMGEDGKALLEERQSRPRPLARSVALTSAAVGFVGRRSRKYSVSASEGSLVRSRLAAAEPLLKQRSRSF